MASLKSIRKRISSVKSTQQITKAMKMVAAAKLRRAQEAAQQARPYADKLATMLQTVAARAAADSAHPLLAERPERRIDLILVTSDRGLCGGYNAGLVRKAEQFIAEHADSEVRLTAVGNKGYMHFRRRPVGVAEQHIQMPAGPGLALALELSARVARDYISERTDGVYVLYSQFRSALSQVPTVERLLPVPPSSEGAGETLDYLYEPDEATLLDRLLRQYITTLIHRAFLESIASEHGARMTAMDNATANARDMIDRLTLAMNRARQAAITTELMEIVSGAEALKG
ncbi:ATP synthase F1 subunit gamma [bacterium]|nr:ATP synthase F1 subunit gamma [bacterium]